MLKERRDHFPAELRRLFADQLRFRVPTGGLHLWARFNTPGDDRERLEAAIAAGVVVAPGRLYGATDGHVRFTHAMADPVTATEALLRLRSAWF